MTQPPYVSMSSKKVELEAKAEEAFAFLPQREGFVQTRTTQGGYATTYNFMAEQFALEVRLDYYEGRVRVYVAKVRNGELPPPERMTDEQANERVRIALVHWLRDKMGVQDHQVDALYTFLIRADSSYETAVESVTRWAEVVTQYAGFLRRQPLDALFPPPDAKPAHDLRY